MRTDFIIPLREAFDWRFFHIFLLLLALYLLCLLINDWQPMSIVDSRRYNPDVAKWRLYGSTFPKLLNTPLHQLWGIAGSSITGMLFLSFGLARLINTSMRYFDLEYKGWKDKGVIFISLAAGLFSFSPFYAVMIASEAYAMGFFGIFLAVLLTGKMTWLDALLLLVLADTNSSNMYVAFILLVLYLLCVRRRVLLVCSLVLLIAGSSVADNLYYRYDQPDIKRYGASYAGGMVLSYYSFILDRTCQDDPSFSLCSPRFIKYIERKRQESGGARLFDGGWMTFVKIQRLQKRLGISSGLHRFEQEIAPELVRRFVMYLPEYWPQVVRATLRNVVFTGTYEMFFMNPGHLSVVHSTAMRTWPFCVDRHCEGRGKQLYASVAAIQYILLPALLVLLVLLKHTHRKKLIYICVAAIAVLWINAMVTGNIGGMVTRLHYRLFFLVTLPVCLMLLLLGDRIRDVNWSGKGRSYSFKRGV